MAVSLALFHYHYYPHGMRAGKLTTFMGALAAYSKEHDGWYPADGTNAFASLQKLYPRYEQEGLAGMSGDESKTLSWLKSGQTLDGTVSSWVYFPGFRNDDNPKLAIIWEREAGIFINGTRADGHAVGFAAFGYAQIPSTNWPSFLKEQEALRAEVLKNRSTLGGKGTGAGSNPRRE